MVRIIRLGAIAGVVALGWALARPAPRLPSPLLLRAETPQGISVHDLSGRPVLRDVRAIEPGVFYTGSALPTGEGADETAFVFLRKNNVRLVVSLRPDQQTFYDEDGYLRYWREQTGYEIATLWLPVAAEHAYALSDLSALHAAAELISRLKRQWPPDGALYLHGDDSAEAPAIVVAAYELWRNRGWEDPDRLWTSVERRFLQTVSGLDVTNVGSQPQAFRALRRRMEYLGDL